MKRLIPLRSASRRPIASAFWADKWKTFILPIAVTGLLVNAMILGNMSYLYGVLFESTHRSHALKVLVVDFDGGEIGQAVAEAYGTLRSSEFPTLEFRPVEDYPTPAAVHEAVCHDGYWGAVYSHAGASDRLMEAIEGNATGAYNPNDAITYTYEGVYYPIIAASVIEASMHTLSSVASSMYYTLAPGAAAAVNLSDPASAQAFLSPFQASPAVMSPSTHGVRVLMNTITMVMPNLMQFFFLMGMNAVMADNGVLRKMSKRDVYLFRLGAGKVHTCLCGLVTAGYIWAFREGWDVSGGQFALTWMCFWLYADVGHQFIDTIEAVVPHQLLGVVVFTWIITNVASSIAPFELSAGFYRWGWALPAHNAWLLMMSIWSHGCKPHNHDALPVLLAEWVLFHATGAWASRRRCVRAEEAEPAANLEPARPSSMAPVVDLSRAGSRVSRIGSRSSWAGLPQRASWRASWASPLPEPVAKTAVHRPKEGGVSDDDDAPQQAGHRGDGTFPLPEGWFDSRTTLEGRASGWESDVPRQDMV